LRLLASSCVKGEREENVTSHLKHVRMEAVSITSLHNHMIDRTNQMLHAITFRADKTWRCLTLGRSKRCCMILKRIVREFNVDWFHPAQGRCCGWLLWTQQWTFLFHKRRVISWLAELLLASEELLCSMQLHVNGSKYYFPCLAVLLCFREVSAMILCPVSGSSDWDCFLISFSKVLGWNRKLRPLLFIHILFNSSFSSFR
jgi:hypothetical protein